MNGPEAVARAPESIERGRTDVWSGEATSLEAFVQEHYLRLVRLAGIITRDADQAQDAVQAALERAWRKRRDLRETDRLRPWLDRIVAREAIRLSGSRLTRFFTGRPTEWVDTGVPGLEHEELTSLREALGRLSPEHRAVVALHLYAGYTVEQTARLLSIPHDTVRSRLRAARARLRRELGEVQP